jgi:phosphate:Na+ symporter
MSGVAMITAVLTLFAGVGVFLTACEMLSSNLETLGSSKLRDLFATAAKTGCWAWASARSLRS